MRRSTIAASLLLLAAFAAPARAQITLELVAALPSPEVEPLFLAQPAGESRLFVVDRPGRIRVLEEGVLQPDVFLDLSASVRNPIDGEGGLLGLAFAPDYAQSGHFYVYYTGFSETSPVDMRSVVSRFTAIGDPIGATSADLSSEQVVFELDQPFTNHNGGTVVIADGHLYLGLGDGGSGGDPLEAAQDDGSLLGKLIRLDLSLPSPSTEDWEVVAKGLRNPFRFSFDPATGDLYIGDVGQREQEEVDVVPAGAIGGVAQGETPTLDFGWDVMEGNLCFSDGPPEPSEPPCFDASLTPPVFVYDHPGNEIPGAVTGGAVYRGDVSRSLRGTYFFADAARSLFFQLRWSEAGGLESAEEITDSLVIDGGQLRQPVAIAPDAAGELYVVSRLGQIHRIVPEAGATSAALAAIGALAWRRARTRA